MRRNALLFPALLWFCANLAAQSAAPPDASKIFAYDASKPLNLTIGKTESVRGVTVSEISYDSPKGGRVPGYLVVPQGKGPFPAIVYMHWGQGNKGEFLSEAVDMAVYGQAISIMIDAPYWRPDVPPPVKGHEAESERNGYIQMVTDLRRAVDVLVARKDVDPKRIGYVGHSLGATWGVPLAAAEKRIRVFVLMGGLPKVPADWDDDSFYQEVQRASVPRAEFDKEATALAPIEPEKFGAQTAPAKIYFQWAQHDMYISKKSADEYFNAVTGPKEQKWYFTSHEFNDLQSRSNRYWWLEKQLGIVSHTPQRTP